MSKHLYLLRSVELAQGRTDPFSQTFFGLLPDGKGDYNDFHTLRRAISLKQDLQWEEVANLQKLFSGAGIWENFPVEGLKFVYAELKSGDENQRIDVLYLRDDGGLYPCELKLGGDYRDTHGQLIRYIADLHYQDIDADWLVAKRLQYLRNKGMNNELELKIEETELRDYLTAHDITDRHLRVIQNAGIIVDESFPHQMLTAVRYLNEKCGFSIRLLRLAAYVAEDWNPTQQEYKVRLDITEIQ